MTKTLLFIWLLSILSISSPLDIDWGMKITDLKGGKTSNISIGSITTNEMIYGKKCSVVYDFNLISKNEQTLKKVMYYFKQMDEVTVIDDYHSIKRAISMKYGLPSSYQKTWLCNTLQDNRDAWGTAVAYNHLVYITKWNTDEFKIEFQVFGEMGNIYQLLTIQRKI